MKDRLRFPDEPIRTGQPTPEASDRANEVSQTHTNSAKDWVGLAALLLLWALIVALLLSSIFSAGPLWGLVEPFLGMPAIVIWYGLLVFSLVVLTLFNVFLIGIMRDGTDSPL